MTFELLPPLLILALMGAPADPSEAEKKQEAGRLLEEGNTALTQGDATTALASYRAAYAAYPSPKIKFNLAEAHLELGDLIAAAQSYEEVIGLVDPSSPLVEAAHEKLSNIDRKLARLTVATVPEEASVQLDGQPLERREGVRLQPGRYDLRVEIDARTKSETVELAAGESREILIEVPSLAPPPPVAVRTERPIVEEWWFWAAVVGGTVLVAGTITGIAVSSGGDDFVPMGELGTTSLDEWDRR